MITENIELTQLKSYGYVISKMSEEKILRKILEPKPERSTKKEARNDMYNLDRNNNKKRKE